MTMRRWLVLGALVLLAAGLVAPGDAARAWWPGPDSARQPVGEEYFVHPAAGPLNDCEGTVETPTKVVLMCRPGFVFDLDRLTIYPGTPLPAGADWRQAVNTEDAMWVFDPGARDRPTLVITFRRERSALIADLYMDVDGDNKVGLTDRENEAPRVTEIPNVPSMQVSAPDGWWTRGEMTNFNLNIRVDGPVIGMMDTPFHLDRMRTDTRTDLEIFVRDTDGDGRPQYEWRQAYPQVSRSDGVYRTSINVNPHDDEVPMTGWWGWPYLKAQRPAESFTKGYNISLPPIQVEWEEGRVRQIGEVVASRGGAHNWFINSIKRIAGPGEFPALNPELADFESPFAYYDLAGRADGMPDTVARFSYFFPHDPYFRSGYFGNAVGQIDYSWTLRRGVPDPLAPVWDYKVSVAGHYLQEGVVQLPDFRVRVVPYEQVPRWVAEKTWHVATFVAREAEGYPSNEGMYEWYPLEGSGEEGYSYIVGAGEAIPYRNFQTLPFGFRGEYSFRLNEPVRLYVSPFDRRLHLYGAEAGVWAQSETREVRYRATPGSMVIDRWTQLENGREVESLRAVGGYLVHGTGDTVRVRETTVPVMQWERGLPASPEDWSAYRDGVPEIDPLGVFPPLAQEFDRFTGPALSVPGVRLLDTVAAGDGIRLVLESERAKQIGLGEELSPLELPVGISALTIQPGQSPKVAPARPATPVVAELTLPDTPREATQGEIRAVIRNEGDVSLENLPVTVAAVGPAGLTRMLGQTSVSLAAGAETEIAQVWAPDAVGRWTVQIEVGGASHSVVAEVQPLPSVGPGDVIEATGVSTAAAVRIITGVVLLLGLAALVFGSLWSWMTPGDAGP